MEEKKQSSLSERQSHAPIYEALERFRRQAD